MGELKERGDVAGRLSTHSGRINNKQQKATKGEKSVASPTSKERKKERRRPRGGGAGLVRRGAKVAHTGSAGSGLAYLS